MKRGDVVILDFPYKKTGSKVRPALVVQNDRDNARISSTIVVLITGNLQRINEPTHALVDPTTGDGANSGLHNRSLVNASHFFTIEQTSILRRIGGLSPQLKAKVDDCLKASLGL